MSNVNVEINSYFKQLSELGLRYDLTLSQPMLQENDQFLLMCKLEIMEIDADGKLRTFRKTAVGACSENLTDAMDNAIFKAIELTPLVGLRIN
jgi:hypothetical protein